MSQFAQYPSLQDKVVFVTGGGSGIGASIVSHFCEQGARVYFVDLADGPSRALVEEIGQRGDPPPVFRHCDLRDIATLQNIVREVTDETGVIDILVNNAAHDERHKIEDVTLEYWEDRMQVNLRHQFFTIQAALPGLRQAGEASIVNMGSASWHAGQGGMPGYTSAKAGVEGLTRGLARDLGPDRIRVNCVIPGWVMTERQKRLWLTPEAEADLLKKQCLKDKIQPADLARMVLWLAAADSRACTAQSYIVDSGWL